MGSTTKLGITDVSDEMEGLLDTDLDTLLAELSKDSKETGTPDLGEKRTEALAALSETPEGIYEIPGNSVFTVELTSGDNQKLIDSARTLCSAVQECNRSRVLQVKGGHQTISITLSANDVAVINAYLEREKISLGEKGVITDVRKSQKPLAVGMVADEMVVEDRKERRPTEMHYTPIEASSLQVSDRAKRKRLSDGERDASIVALTHVLYQSPEALELIRAEAEKFGAIIVAPSLGEVTLVCLGEKTLAGAGQLAKTITEKVPGAKAAVTAAHAMHIVDIEGQTVLLDSGDRSSKGHQVVMNLKRYLRKNPEVNIVIDEKSAQKTTDERVQTEATFTFKENSVRGVKEITNVERGALKLAGPSRLIGREAEVERLNDFMDAQYDPEWNYRDTARTLAVTGGAGHGKTRLGAEVVTTHDGIYETASPVHSFETGWFLQRVLEVILATARKKNSVEKSPSGVQIDPTEEEFFLGLNTENIERFIAGDWSGLDKVKLAEELRTLLNNIASKNNKDKTVLFLDNLEACDEFSAQILSVLLSEKWESMQNVHFLLGGRTGTGEEIPGPLVPFFRDSLEVKPLTLVQNKKPTTECVEFAKAQLGAAPEDTIEEDLLMLIAEHSKGVPLFFIGTCRTLKESGSVRRLPTGVWTKTASLEEIKSVLGPTGEGIIETRLENVVGRGSPEMVRTFGTLVALGRINAVLLKELTERGIVNEEIMRRLQEVGIMTREGDGEYTFSHPLYLEKGPNFVPHSVIREISGNLAVLFNEWQEESLRERTEIEKNGLKSGELTITIFALAEKGGVGDLIKKYAVPAAYTLRDSYQNERCVAVAKAGSKAMQGDRAYNGQRVELELLAATGEMRLSGKNHEYAHRRLTGLWQACKQAPVSQSSGRLPKVAEQVIEALCNNAYIQGGSVGIANLEAGIREWETHADALPSDPSAKIALYTAYLKFRKQETDEALQICRHLKDTAPTPDIRREAQRMVGMARYNGVFFYNPSGDQEIMGKAIGQNTTLRKAFTESASDMEDYVNAELTGEIKIEDQTRIPVTMARIAFVKMTTGKLDEAKTWAERASRAAKKAGLPLQQARAYNMLGEVLQATGKIDDAIQNFTQAYIRAAGTREAEAEWPVSAYNLARGLQKKGGLENKKRAIALGMEAVGGFAMEFFKGYQTENDCSNAGMNKRTKTAIAALFTGGNPTDAVITTAIEAALDDPALQSEFPPEDIAFYPLQLLSELSTKKEDMPPVIRKLCIRGMQTLSAREANVATSTLEEPVQTFCISELEKKHSSLARLAT